MSDIGSVLRTAREEKNITLEMVEKETSIRKTYLEAIETNDFSVIPGEVFVKGIIRTYGNYLGLDGLKLVEDYKAAAGIQTGNVPAPEDHTIRETTKVKVHPCFHSNRDIGSGNGNGHKKWLGMIGALLAVAAIGAASYYYFFGPLPDNDVVVKQGPAASSATAGTSSSASAPGKSSAPDAASEATTIGEGDNSLKITSKGRCWVRVTNAENRVLYEGTLLEGQTQQFRDKSWLRVNIGNLQDLSIEHNGTVLPPEITNEPVIRTYGPAGKDMK
ncbi:MAG: DUF4115 domain-containing protein [Succiniclasticum sp.]|nr:DUF4115 domain-containing protein [Succiniclasticum sp.]